METMSPMANALPPTIELDWREEDMEKFAMTPWFSYRVNLPIRPLPTPTERPHIQTRRLIVRPIVESDLDAFFELRSEPRTQFYSTTRGRPDRDREETRQRIANMQEPYDGAHWYFGAFLQETGEMIGEGGITDCQDMPRSGWPEAEILIKPAYWRQGYGTELWTAVMDSWWALPREPRRHQLIPLVVGAQEPGDDIVECVGYVWEEPNPAARHFFAKVLGQAPIAVSGSFVDFEQRQGREPALVRWAGTIGANPRAIDDGT